MTQASQHQDAPLYCADPAQGRKIVALDPLYAIYQRRSGMTHIVDEMAPMLLAQLGEGGLTLDQLIAALERDYALEAEGDVRAVVLGRLAELQSVGLVWRG
jgi:PqqD family protein of HPr-rel-A system